MPSHLQQEATHRGHKLECGETRAVRVGYALQQQNRCRRRKVRLEQPLSFKPLWRGEGPLSHAERGCVPIGSSIVRWHKGRNSRRNQSLRSHHTTRDTHHTTPFIKRHNPTHDPPHRQTKPQITANHKQQSPMNSLITHSSQPNANNIRGKSSSVEGAPTCASSNMAFAAER